MEEDERGVEVSVKQNSDGELDVVLRINLQGQPEALISMPPCVAARLSSSISFALQLILSGEAHKVFSPGSNN